LESPWWVILIPLELPLAAAVAGTLAGSFTAIRYLRARHASNPVLLVLVVLASVAAIIPNAGQWLFDLGISFPWIGIWERASYFVLAFAVTWAWRLLGRSWKRWLLMIFLPVAFAQPMLTTFAYICWSIKGFAP
jgi:hypothetical protein